MIRLALFVGIIMGGVTMFCLQNWPIENYLPPNEPSGIAMDYEPPHE